MYRFKLVFNPFYSNTLVLDCEPLTETNIKQKKM